MIRQVDHVNSATQGLQSTRDVYVEALGFEDGPRPAFRGFPGHWLYAGGRAIIHLQQAKAPVTPSRGSAIDHVAFETDDFDALIARLEARGIEFRTAQIPNAPVR